VKACLMGGIEATSVPPTPSMPDTTICGDPVAAISLLYHHRL
jgi:hypothetical protein